MYNATAANAAMKRKIKKNTQKYIRKIKRTIWWDSHKGFEALYYYIKKQHIIDQGVIMAYFEKLGYHIEFDYTLSGINYFLIKWNQKKGDNE